jgi:hypothetical protein
MQIIIEQETLSVPYLCVNLLQVDGAWVVLVSHFCVQRDPEGPGARCFQRTLQDDDDGDDDDGEDDDDDDDADDYDDDDDDDDYDDDDDDDDDEEEDDDEDLDEDDADYEEEIGALVTTYPRSY